MSGLAATPTSSNTNEGVDYFQAKLAAAGSRPCYSIDVECVAIGRTHMLSDRAP